MRGHGLLFEPRCGQLVRESRETAQYLAGDAEYADEWCGTADLFDDELAAPGA